MILKLSILSQLIKVFVSCGTIDKVRKSEFLDIVATVLLAAFTLPAAFKRCKIDHI